MESYKKVTQKRVKGSTNYLFLALTDFCLGKVWCF